MGSACSGLSSRAIASSARTVKAPVPRKRLPQPQECIKHKDGVWKPAALQQLCVQCICQHIDRFPKLRLPVELAQQVLSHLAARTWLDFEALSCLQESELLKIEIPNCALLEVQGSMPRPYTHEPSLGVHAPSPQDYWLALIAKQQQLVRARAASQCTQSPYPCMIVANVHAPRSAWTSRAPARSPTRASAPCLGCVSSVRPPPTPPLPLLSSISSVRTPLCVPCACRGAQLARETVKSCPSR